MALGVSPAHFFALQTLFANNHASCCRYLIDTEITSIRFFEPATLAFPGPKLCADAKTMLLFAISAA
jgi:hypothetical protein